MRLTKPELLLSFCAVLLVGLTAIGLIMPHDAPGQFGIGYGAALQRFIGLACVQGLVYFAAVGILRQRNFSPKFFWVILGVAGLLRLMVVIVPPFLSNDMYRYIWDGWVQAAGINPYRYIPADPHLAFLRDAIVFPNINRATYAHTIYPPAAEIFFAVSTRIISFLSLPPVLGMKLSMLIAEATGIWAIIRLLRQAGLPRHRILIYTWNPLPLWEFAGSGHVDAIAVCFIALALLAVSTGWRGFGAAALAAAVLTKFLPIILFPALWRRWDWKFAGIFTGFILLLYLPYLGVGKGVFGFLSGYTAQENINSGRGIFPLDLLNQVFNLPAKLYLVSAILILAGVAAAMLFWRPAQPGAKNFTNAAAQRATLLGCLLMAALSPHYPWYYAWLLVPACIAPAFSSLYLVTGSFLLYLNPTHTKLLWPAMLFGPFAALAVRDVWTSLKAVPAREGLKP